MTPPCGCHSHEKERAATRGCTCPAPLPSVMASCRTEASAWRALAQHPDADTRFSSQLQTRLQKRIQPLASQPWTNIVP
jgi:hypothetical protein